MKSQEGDSPVADIVFVGNIAEQWKQWNSENDIL